MIQPNLVFVIDDEPGILEIEERILKRNYTVEAFSDPRQALDTVTSGRIPLVFVTDIKMPEMSGMELIAELRGKGIEQPVVLVSGCAEKSHAIRALELGVFSLLEKPFQTEHFRSAVAQAMVFANYQLLITRILEDYQVFESKARELLKVYAERYVEAENRLDSVGISIADRESVLKVMKTFRGESQLTDLLDTLSKKVANTKYQIDLIKEIVKKTTK